MKFRVLEYNDYCKRQQEYCDCFNVARNQNLDSRKFDLVIKKTYGNNEQWNEDMKYGNTWLCGWNREECDKYKRENDNMNADDTEGLINNLGDEWAVNLFNFKNKRLVESEVITSILKWNIGKCVKGEILGMDLYSASLLNLINEEFVEKLETLSSKKVSPCVSNTAISRGCLSKKAVDFHLRLVNMEYRMDI